MTSRIEIESTETLEKFNRLEAILKDMRSVVVAYSGGVDSGLLSLVAHRVLGEQMLAVTIHSPLEAAGELESALHCAEKSGFPVRVVEVNDLENPDLVRNPAERCYFCKANRFTLLDELRLKLGFNYSAEGSNADDESAYRPGKRAVRELGVRSPLAEAGLTKSEIRILAKALSLSSWEKPSAPCLATRFPYGTTITQSGLDMVARAESVLSRMGFESVRVRHVGQEARIEVRVNQITSLMERREEITRAFKDIGFIYISVDLEGYRSGSMDEVLTV